jgi:hypothetical protein
MECKYCDFKTGEKGTMAFHLLIGHDLLDEFVNKHRKSES